MRRSANQLIKSVVLLDPTRSHRQEDDLLRPSQHECHLPNYTSLFAVESVRITSSAMPDVGPTLVALQTPDYDGRHIC
jgi:hypothetical protein